MNTQQLSISWLGGAATTFDLLILRTELNETVFYVRAFLFLLSCSHAFLIVQLYYKLIDCPHQQSSTSFTFCFIPSLCFLCITYRRRCLWQRIRWVVGTSGTGPQLNLWSVPRCRSKSVQEMDRQQVNGATLRYIKVRGAIITPTYIIGHQ